MSIEKLSCGGGGGGMGKRMGANMADTQVRHAIQMIWMALPAERQNVDGVERELRRLVERAIKDLREDAQAFGLEG